MFKPPVKETISTRGSEIREVPTTEPGPRIKLATPCGVPASSMACIKAIALCGVNSEGLTMKEQPATSAGATFQAICKSG